MNLGGWLLLEPWITPKIFQQVKMHSVSQCNVQWAGVGKVEKSLNSSLSHIHFLIALPEVRPMDVKSDWIGAIKQSLEGSLDHSP